MSSPKGPIERFFRLLVALIVICFLGLVAGIVIVSIQSVQTNNRLGVLEEYIQGRGEARDQENARTNQRINDAICDLLDQLPEGGLLDRPRAAYGCGPGVPFDQLTPEEQARVSGVTPPTVAPTTPSVPSGPAPVVGDPASPNAPPAPDPVLPPRPAEPTPGPLAPVTDLVCETTGVCG